MIDLCYTLVSCGGSRPTVRTQLGMNGQPGWASGNALVLIVTGTGISVRQAQSQAYARIKNILIPNMYYRDDIGDRWFEDHDKLHSWGYLR